MPKISCLGGGRNTNDRQENEIMDLFNVLDATIKSFRELISTMQLFRQTGPSQQDLLPNNEEPSNNQPGTSKQFEEIERIQAEKNKPGTSNQFEEKPVNPSKKVVQSQTQKLELYEFDFTNEKDIAKEKVPNLGEIIPSEELTQEFLELKKKLELENFTFKDYTREQAFIEKKSFWQDQIVEVFGKYMVRKCDYEGFHDYVFHYTDPISALSILTDGHIYSYLMPTDFEKFGQKPYIYFTKLKPTSKNEDLVNSIYDLSNLGSKQLQKIHRSKFRKLHYAFGFKRDDLKSCLKKYSPFNKELTKFDGDLELNSFKFILVVR